MKTKKHLRNTLPLVKNIPGFLGDLSWLCTGRYPYIKTQQKRKRHTVKAKIFFKRTTHYKFTEYKLYTLRG